MVHRGFTLIEMALVILIAGIVLSGFLQILNANIQTRQTQILNESVETMKTTAVLSAFNARTLTGTCYIGACVPTGPCAGITPCYGNQSSYTIPGAIAVQKDAWGNDMAYTRLSGNVTAATPPATNLFRIVSRGPDATVGTGDDITYTVNAAEFMARVSRFGL